MTTRYSGEVVTICGATHPMMWGVACTLSPDHADDHVCEFGVLDRLLREGFVIHQPHRSP